MTTDLALTEDPRAQAEGICGVTQTTGGTEWICVRQVHDDGRRTRPRPYETPQADRHYMVNRYPWRGSLAERLADAPVEVL